MKSYESKLEKPILEHGWVTHARKTKKDKRRNGGGIEWNRNGRTVGFARGVQERERKRERGTSVFATIGRMCEGLPLQITMVTAKRE